MYLLLSFPNIRMPKGRDFFKNINKQNGSVWRAAEMMAGKTDNRIMLISVYVFAVVLSLN